MTHTERESNSGASDAQTYYEKNQNFNPLVSWLHSIRYKYLIELFDKQQSENPNKQIIVLQDSLQTLDDGKYNNGFTNGNTPVRCTEMLTEWAKSTNGIVAFIGQVTKSGEFSGKNTILHAVDVRGKLFIDEDKRSPNFGQRIFETTKNRFGCSGRSYILGLESRGLIERGSF